MQPYPDGGRRSLISNGGGQEPAWAADGREIFYRVGDRLADVVRRLLDRVTAERDAPNTTRVDVERQLAEVETALERLTAAVASGGDIPALVDAIKTQDDQRRVLRQRLEELRRAPVAFDRQLERRLRAAVTEWRAVLGRQVGQARQIVTKLLAGRLTFAPERRSGRCGFRFQATGTVEKLIAGVVPGQLSTLHTVASPTGPEFNIELPPWIGIMAWLQGVETFRKTGHLRVA